MAGPQGAVLAIDSTHSHQLMETEFSSPFLFILHKTPCLLLLAR